MSQYGNASVRDMADDLIVQVKGDRLPVAVGPLLRSSGWRGGTFVYYISSIGPEEYVVEKSDGIKAVGFLVNPSEHYSATETWGAPRNYTGTQNRLPQGFVSGSGVVTMMAGGGRHLFKVYETIALAGDGTRTGGAISYALNQTLRVSENGLLCNDSEANLIAAGIPAPISIGFCSAIPHSRNGYRVGVDLRM